MKIGIFYKKENPEIIGLIKSEASKYNFIFDNDNPDVVFSIGGDGTFLKSVHKYINSLNKIVFIGINAGTLGFFYDFTKENISEIFETISSNNFKYEERPLLGASVKYKKSVEEIYAINEIRIENPFHTLTADVFVNNELLEPYCGNGLIVSSNLGSSGYNKSLGGALIDHDLVALELTEVASIQNKAYRSLNSPLVLNPNKIIEFKNVQSDSIVGYDHLSIHKSDELLEVKIGYSNKKVKILYSKEHNYVQRIRKSFVL